MVNFLSPVLSDIVGRVLTTLFFPPGDDLSPVTHFLRWPNPLLFCLFCPTGLFCKNLVFFVFFFFFKRRVTPIIFTSDRRFCTILSFAGRISTVFCSLSPSTWFLEPHDAHIFFFSLFLFTLFPLLLVWFSQKEWFTNCFFGESPQVGWGVSQCVLCGFLKMPFRVVPFGDLHAPFRDHMLIPSVTVPIICRFVYSWYAFCFPSSIYF